MANERSGRSGGGARAFEELITAHLDALYRTALRLCAGNVPEAEDLLQDAVLRALEKHRQLRDPEAARSWLFTILVRTNHNRLRSSRRRSETAITDFTLAEFESALSEWQPSSTPEQVLDRSELRSRLARCLDTLERELREVIWLADVEEFAHREVAAMLAIPEGTVASRLFRARRALRRSLERTEEAAALRAI
ncbi:MAG: sigma-70 family RNA polymerase sigma factor [Gemmatimonadaceae bacterium]